MIGKPENEGKPVSMPEALDILEERKKAGPLGYEQELAYNHAKLFATLSSDKAEKMRKALLAEGLTIESSTKIVDLMPVNDTQLRQVLAGHEKNTVEAEKVSKIMEIINSYKK